MRPLVHVREHQTLYIATLPLAVPGMVANMTKSVLPSDGSSHPDEQQLWLSGSKASRHGWIRVCDATERVFYHSIDSGIITLERPADFGDDNPVWADGKCSTEDCGVF